jgi:ABC-type multidrug transport system fused ATPase/permease subunit
MTYRRISSSPFVRSFKVLTRQDKYRILIVTVFQVLMGFLDLFGILAIGLAGALSVGGIKSDDTATPTSKILSMLNLDALSTERQAVVLGLIAVSLLMGRTVLSIFFTRRILFFFSRRGARISADLISKILSQPLLMVQSRTTQETVYAITIGVERLVLQILASSVVCVSDLSLLIVMLIGLLIIDPGTALATFSVFFFVGFFLYRYMHIRAGALGIESADLNISSNEKIVEVFSSYREAVVGNRREFYAREIGKIRYSLADSSAEISFLPYVSKYVIETTVIVGALMIGGIQYFLQDSANALMTSAIFFTAATRIAPAVLRLQQGYIYIKNGLGLSRPTLELIESLRVAPLVENSSDLIDLTHADFLPDIVINQVSFSYPNQKTPAISEINLTVPPGSSIAFVGLSGAGKTTMVDILMGILKPDIGSVLISGCSPSDAVTKWPGAVAYVPQDIAIASGTIRENVGQGYPPEVATDELVMNALKIAGLNEFVTQLPNGIDTQVGERGARMSGGQRQRLGIARALFTRPRLLVLDEATSSLDGETEASISNAINSLRGSTTLVIIAHRLSTIREVNKVVYLSSGKALAYGTFNEVRDRVPAFDRQARIMGL